MSHCCSILDYDNIQLVQKRKHKSWTNPTLHFYWHKLEIILFIIHIKWTQKHTMLKYVPCTLYSLSSRPTNAQYIYIYIYTGCNRRNGPDFGRVFLMLNYTNITQNTYIQSWTVTEIIAREKCGLHRSRHTIRHPWCHTCPMRPPDNETL